LTTEWLAGLLWLAYYFSYSCFSFPPNILKLKNEVAAQDGVPNPDQRQEAKLNNNQVANMAHMVVHHHHTTVQLEAGITTELDIHLTIIHLVVIILTEIIWAMVSVILLAKVTIRHTDTTVEWVMA